MYDSEEQVSWVGLKTADILQHRYADSLKACVETRMRMEKEEQTYERQMRLDAGNL